MLTYNKITKNEAIKTYIIRADESLGALGFTEHSFAHVTHVAETAGYILKTLGHDGRTIELAKIAGYLHDIGNLVNRKDHAQSGAVMAWSILNDMGCDAAEVATIVTAIGESATINWTDFLRAYTINPYEERNFNYVREKTT